MFYIPIFPPLIYPCFELHVNYTISWRSMMMSHTGLGLVVMTSYSVVRYVHATHSLTCHSCEKRRSCYLYNGSVSGSIAKRYLHRQVVLIPPGMSIVRFVVIINL
jgi:hypothetical protein